MQRLPTRRTLWLRGPCKLRGQLGSRTVLQRRVTRYQQSTQGKRTPIPKLPNKRAEQKGATDAGMTRDERDDVTSSKQTPGKTLAQLKGRDNKKQ